MRKNFRRFLKWQKNHDSRFTNNLNNIKLIITEGYNQDKCYEEIAKELNTLGYTTRNGKSFNLFSVSNFAKKNCY